MNLMLDLFITFLKIGSFTFGGGLAMLPMLKNELIYKKNWIDEEDIIKYYSLGQCTPGIIAVNVSTFVGYKLGGILGSIFATMGIILPSFLIIILIASFISNILDITLIQNMFSGIKIAVFGLVFTTVLSLIKNNIKNFKSLSIFIVVFILNFCLKISPIYITFLTVLFSIFYNKLFNKE